MDIDEQIACVKKEYQRRKRLFPKLVEDGKIPRDMAQAEIARMKAVMETLSQLRALAGRRE
ncbi:hypothetical protein [Microbulbifer celer]|uniref:DUF465 domain-containing protein n=1 Tax=Microbulbifer celer TaxID=435905 RepID=A0ABW3U6Q3_9GAMM|nr:hypothetical protein [Microbulbifer celer]UFN58567.1 hypothetical protein LPW13_05860 [Microbulbifer celer]